MMATTTSKPRLPALQTPVSSTYPSELRSPMVGSPASIKREESIKTPITPPAAYVDFLKALSPILPSPSTGKSQTFNFPIASVPSTASLSSSGSTPPTSQPSSTTSSTFSADGDASKSAKMIVPPTPFSRPVSARMPRRLLIPQSPYSPVRSPMSAHAAQSPYTMLSPQEWDPDGKARVTGAAKGAVSVRQVVTRTVTYSRTPIEPAPKGKRRKLEGESP